ncbi:MAG: RidA family protein [Acidobacteria bacterium]|nr:RidA family protein [Acidobacteriota bacterium]
MTRDVIQPDSLKDPRPRYSQGIRTDGGKLLFISGQTAADREGNVVGKGDPEAQCEQVFANLRAVLAAAGGSFQNLMMTTTYLTDIKYRDAYNKVRLKYYSDHQPTSTLVVVRALGSEDFLIEIDGIAVI